MPKFILAIISLHVLILYCKSPLTIVEAKAPSKDSLMLSPKTNSIAGYLQKRHPFLRQVKLTKNMKSLLRNLRWRDSIKQLQCKRKRKRRYPAEINPLLSAVPSLNAQLHKSLSFLKPNVLNSILQQNVQTTTTTPAPLLYSSQQVLAPIIVISPQLEQPGLLSHTSEEIGSTSEHPDIIKRLNMNKQALPSLIMLSPQQQPSALLEQNAKEIKSSTTNEISVNEINNQVPMVIVSPELEQTKLAQQGLRRAVPFYGPNVKDQVLFPGLVQYEPTDEPSTKSPEKLVPVIVIQSPIASDLANVLQTRVVPQSPATIPAMAETVISIRKTDNTSAPNLLQLSAPQCIVNSNATNTTTTCIAPIKAVDSSTHFQNNSTARVPFEKFVAVGGDELPYVQNAGEQYNFLNYIKLTTNSPPFEPVLPNSVNLNSPKRTSGSSTAYVHNTSDMSESTTIKIEAEQFMAEILTNIEEIRNSQNQSSEKEGLPCHINGSWATSAAGILIRLLSNDHHVSVAMSERTPPSTEGFLLDYNEWNFTGVIPFGQTNRIILSGLNSKNKHILIFVGECRICSTVDTISGTWLSSRPSHDCNDEKSSMESISDVWKRESITELRKERWQHIKDLKPTTAKKRKKKFNQRIFRFLKSLIKKKNATAVTDAQPLNQDNNTASHQQLEASKDNVIVFDAVLISTVSGNQSVVTVENGTTEIPVSSTISASGFSEGQSSVGLQSVSVKTVKPIKTEPSSSFKTTHQTHSKTTATTKQVTTLSASTK